MECITRTNKLLSIILLFLWLILITIIVWNSYYLYKLYHVLSPETVITRFNEIISNNRLYSNLMKHSFGTELISIFEDLLGEFDLYYRHNIYINFIVILSLLIINITTIFLLHKNQNIIGILKFKNKLSIDSKIEDSNTLLQGLAHELRTPTLAIHSMCSNFVNEFKLDIQPNLVNYNTSECIVCKNRNYLRRLVSMLEEMDIVSQHINEITRSLVDYSKQNTINHKTSTNLKLLLKSSIKYSKFSDSVKIVPQDNIKYVDLIPELDVFCELIPTEFIMMVQNIISNSSFAIKDYSDSLQDEEQLLLYNPYIIISVKINKNNIHIKIEDNGIGMSEEEIQLYSSNLKSSRSDTYGSGIGSFVIKNTLSNIDGYLEIKSIKNKGTSINLYIPLHYKEIIIEQMIPINKPVSLYKNNIVIPATVMCTYLSKYHVEVLIPRHLNIKFNTGDEIQVRLWYNIYFWVNTKVISYKKDVLLLSVVDNEYIKVHNYIYNSL